MLLVVISYGLVLGGTAAWGGVLNYSLIDLGLDQVIRFVYYIVLSFSWIFISNVLPNSCASSCSGCINT